jgi:hypothetical protein
MSRRPHVDGPTVTLNRNDAPLQGTSSETAVVEGAPIEDHRRGHR